MSCSFGIRTEYDVGLIDATELLVESDDRVKSSEINSEDDVSESEGVYAQPLYKAKLKRKNILQNK